MRVVEEKLLVLLEKKFTSFEELGDRLSSSRKSLRVLKN